jgi:transposase
MEKQLITKTERVDDIPLLVAQMRKMRLAELIDEQFPAHGNWQGLSIGQVVVVWLAYILSEGDHCLNHVESWAVGLLETLSTALGIAVRGLDFSDDRLAVVLDHLSGDDDWEGFEVNLNRCLLRVYDLKVERVRTDSTSAKGYVQVTEEGLFQFGHSKDHRPDLPQVKIQQSALDPLGLPLTTTVVSGNRADDPLYVPEIRKVQESVGYRGVLYVGDCKMASLETRAYVAGSGDLYLCPLSAVQVPTAELERLLRPVWERQQSLTPVYRPLPTEEEEPEKIAEGFSYPETLRTAVAGKAIEWEERRLVVRSLKQAERQEKTLKGRLDKAQQAIADLNRRGRGRKCLDENELCAAVAAIVDKHRVGGLLQVEYRSKTKTIHQRAYGGRPAQTLTKNEVTVHTALDLAAYQDAVRHLGWRVYGCNDRELSLSEAVLAYREEYLVERGFARYKGKTLGLTPLYLSSNNRVKGLIRLLSIGLRVLCLLEFTARKTLQAKGEKLAGIYKGNPNRATARPTAEMMLKVFQGISLNEVNFDGARYLCLTPLTPVQKRILELLGLPITLYLALTG